MKNRTITQAMASLLLVTAGAASAFAAGMTPDAKEVLTKLHESNQKEIRMGHIAEDRAQSQAVKDFGQTLVQDHQNADQKVEALASRKNLSLPTPPSASDAKDLPTQGQAFDHRFADMMVQDHKKDIATVKKMRDSTTDPDVKQLLSDVLPTLEKHLNTAQQIASR